MWKIWSPGCRQSFFPRKWSNFLRLMVYEFGCSFCQHAYKCLEVLDLSSCSVPLTPERKFICIRHCVGQCISKCPGPVRLQTKIWCAPYLWKWTLITLYGSNFQAYRGRTHVQGTFFQGGYWLSYIVNDKRTVC